jgi:hypothetical protein
MNLFKLGGAFGALVFSVAAVQAQLISQWNFNSNPSDASTGTGSILPSVGAGTASVVGGVNAGFAAGGPGDVAADNSGWSLSGWPAQGVGSGTAGAQFMVSTAGYNQAIRISFDLRQSTTASGVFQLQATVDGVNFVNVAGGTATFGATGNNSGTAFSASGLFTNTTAASNQGFVQAVTYTFAAGSAYENNPLFGFRLVSVFDGGQYDPAGASASYGAGGTVRLDMVTVSAVSAAPIAPVPESAATGAVAGGTLIALAGWRQWSKTK